MICNKHEKMAVLHAFSEGNCIKCGKEVSTEHIPCNKVCLACSEKFELCEICGDKIKTENK